MRVSRRGLLAGTAAIAGLGALSVPAQALPNPSRWVRFNVTSKMGQEMLKSYAVAVRKMLELPISHPHNWFRNAFVHMMDCPHGNWWFYVWHRGYVGYFEQTVRKYSKNPNFAFPYWDWSQLQELPLSMFADVLTPTNEAFAKFAKDLPTFEREVKPGLEAYWKTLNAEQLAQQKLRGYESFDDMWKAVMGWDPVKQKYNIGDQAFAITEKARYVPIDNRALPEKLKLECSTDNVNRGLAPVHFNASDEETSFTSVRTASHNAAPMSHQGDFFSILEGQPHNHVHNFIGGAFDGPGNWSPGPFGNMTNNLSPVDPIFFLHHANMDRLWESWTAKQKRYHLPFLPQGNDFVAFAKDPFLFFVDAEGNYVLDGKAGDYIDPHRFGYRYDSLVKYVPVSTLVAEGAAPVLLGAAKDGGPVTLSAPAGRLLATISFERPSDGDAPRQYDVLVNAPADVKTVGADSPYYAGTVSFFGGVAAHGPAHAAHAAKAGGNRVTFVVPLPSRLAASRFARSPGAKLDIRLAPPTTQPDFPAPKLLEVEIHSQ
ncbi:twin-arginine translocation signal domain-containing protein [Niveispirillum sp. SYP-B3756]|uniref:tyrosinase family protein n=1 Tax=Niveispirillum sp. SYP-B3756 TaxID=2662178 RepID=UPI0012914131|nr:tyrosinase family protein [Niveispirillum sp. SYP-B3756]MQP67246.1 twin-arginine translocation signal domain-containing protein [Niveispirillum sp. SYP-B3756]